MPDIVGNDSHFHYYVFSSFRDVIFYVFQNVISSHFDKYFFPSHMEDSETWCRFCLCQTKWKMTPFSSLWFAIYTVPGISHFMFFKMVSAAILEKC